MDEVDIDIAYTDRYTHTHTHMPIPAQTHAYKEYLCHTTILLNFQKLWDRSLLYHLSYVRITTFCCGTWISFSYFNSHIYLSFCKTSNFPTAQQIFFFNESYLTNLYLTLILSFVCVTNYLLFVFIKTFCCFLVTHI